MPEQIGLFDAIYTQRAIRYLKPDPIPDKIIEKLVDAAIKAPSGGNSQPWKFIIIRDAETKRKIGTYYNKSWNQVYGNVETGPPLHPRVRSSATYLAEHFHEVPVLIMACIQHQGTPTTMGRGASIYPAVQNILLAARGLGLGSTLTTLHKGFEVEIKEILGIPSNVETAAILPIGYLADDVKYGPTKRMPVDEVIFWEQWNNTSKPHSQE